MRISFTLDRRWEGIFASPKPFRLLRSVTLQILAHQLDGVVVRNFTSDTIRWLNSNNFNREGILQ